MALTKVTGGLISTTTDVVIDEITATGGLISGNLGIGTTNAQYPLHVVGSGSTSLLVQGNARITGILSIGQGTVTIDGNTNTVTASNIVVQSTLTGTGGVGYATEGFVTNSLVGYATEGYVNNQGFVTSGIVVGYATEGFVTQQVTSSKSLTVGTRSGAVTQNLVGTGITIALRTGVGTASI